VSAAWRVITLVALLAPSHLSGWFDGAPLDSLTEALLLGLIAPALLWLHPSFLRRTAVRALVVAIVVVKLAAAFWLQQDGWCITFNPPRPMVRDSTGKPHSWDIRADWLADDPACSAIMTDSYRDSFEMPVWFFNLPPPDDAVVRTGFHPGEIPIRVGGSGYLTVGQSGTFELVTTQPMDAAVRVDGTRVEPAGPGHHRVELQRGSHFIQFEGTLLGKQWRVVPAWNGRSMGSPAFPVATLSPPSRLDRLLRPAGNWLLAVAVLGLVAAWFWSAMAGIGTGALLTWSCAASIAIVIVTTWLPQQGAWYAAAALLLPLLMPVRRRFMNARGLFFLIILPWLAYVGAANVYQTGRWTLYGIGNDNFLFQRFSYRIFMQHYWLEGGQTTFWNQPLFRWIAGLLHMIFGDSSVGQAYWDAAAVAIMSLFAYRVVSPLAGFAWGLPAAVIPLAMFLLGPALEFVGFGLSEISSAGFIYLAAFFLMRHRGARDLVVAGVLVVLGFYTRLNNLPMAIAVAAFALPVSYPAGSWWRVGEWQARARWRAVIAIAVALALGGVLFAWRTWYYTGVFGLFHGTQREFLAVWKPGMTVSDAVPAMLSSVMMVLTGQDPPRFALHSTPLVAAGVISVAALAGIRGCRNAPLPVVALFLAGLSGALITRGWGHEGRFSVHLYGSASVLCVWALAVLLKGIQSARVSRRPHDHSSKARLGDRRIARSRRSDPLRPTRHADAG
jgi:hypothetical protein